MRNPTPLVEMVLNTGDLHVGTRNTRIRTLLGSCVSLTFWHRHFLIGGMCHYMLPSRAHERRSGSRPVAALDGRYADEAIELLMREIDLAGAPRHEYEVKIFGGGDMFPGRSNSEHVGMKNIDAARALVGKYGFNCVAEHVGGVGHRSVVFDVWSGNVWVKHAAPGAHEAADRKGSDRGTKCARFA